MLTQIRIKKLSVALRLVQIISSLSSFLARVAGKSYQSGLDRIYDGVLFLLLQFQTVKKISQKEIYIP